MNITATVAINYQVNEQISLGYASQYFQDQDQPSYAFTNGTGSNQADLHWEKTGVTLAAGASTTYTLSALTDDLGRSVAFVDVAAIAVRCTTRTAGDYLTLGNATTHSWTPIWGATGTEKCYGYLLKVADLTDCFAVASGTSDQLKIVNSGSNSITFSIAILGRSA